MKTKSPLLTSIGALALFVLVVFPNSSARASQGQCGDVEIEVYYDPVVYLEVSVYPEDCVIYYTFVLDNASIVDPSRSGDTPISPTMTCYHGQTFHTTYGHTMKLRAFAYKPLWTQSVNISHFPF